MNLIETISKAFTDFVTRITTEAVERALSEIHETIDRNHCDIVALKERVDSLDCEGVDQEFAEEAVELIKANLEASDIAGLDDHIERQIEDYDFDYAVSNALDNSGEVVNRQEVRDIVNEALSNATVTIEA